MKLTKVAVYRGHKRTGGLVIPTVYIGKSKSKVKIQIVYTQTGTLTATETWTTSTFGVDFDDLVERVKGFSRQELVTYLLANFVVEHRFDYVNDQED